MSTVSWGKRERFKFSNCGAFLDWAPPVVSAVYAITYKQEPDRKPKSHTVLYFGESEDLSQQASVLKRIEEFWTEGGGAPDDLYVFVHHMAGSTKFERSAVQNRLVSEYQPHANHW